jgi:hypothetical protein
MSPCAKDILTMIAAALVTGLGSGAPMLSLAAVAELVLKKMRGTVQACFDLVGLPWNVFGALTGTYIREDLCHFSKEIRVAMVVYHGKYGSRISFMISITLNVISTLALYF